MPLMIQKERQADRQEGKKGGGERKQEKNSPK